MITGGIKYKLIAKSKRLKQCFFICLPDFNRIVYQQGKGSKQYLLYLYDVAFKFDSISI